MGDHMMSGALSDNASGPGADLHDENAVGVGNDLQPDSSSDANDDRPVPTAAPFVHLDPEVRLVSSLPNTRNTESAEDLRDTVKNTGQAIESIPEAPDDDADAAQRNEAARHEVSECRDSLPSYDVQREYDPTPGWEAKRTENGEVYFADHVNGTTSWLDPWDIPDSFVRLSDTLDPLPDGWIQTPSRSRQLYFTYTSSTHTTPWDPRVLLKRLPKGVKATAGRNGDLRVEYTRLARYMAIVWNSESDLEQVVKEFQALEATADRLLAAFDERKTSSSTLRAVSLGWGGEQTDVTPDMMGNLPKSILVIEHLNLPVFRALVDEDVRILGNLRYIFYHDKALEQRLRSALPEFQKAWKVDAGRPWPANEQLREVQCWTGICTWFKSLTDDNYCPLLTFIHRLATEEHKIWGPKINIEICFVTKDSCSTPRYIAIVSKD